MSVFTLTLWYLFLRNAAVRCGGGDEKSKRERKKIEKQKKILS